MLSPNECREHARECARLAEISASPKARETFACLGKTWLALATDLDNSQAVLDEKSEPANQKKSA